MFPNGYLMIFGFAITASNHLVSARFCEGGHRCSPPKECCAQGCCYLYAPPSAPRTPPPNTSHVLNLFFVNHWFFWCIIFAIVIAILCACSLWKKRRQICGWGSPGTHSQSGDSAGSCYAPPQYSRCSSFHHAPPPYTEVTSKPDLYPLVFTCNADNGKNGASYLMVQYFRNYIVRPVGSLSATSTVDSLSSSFICNANEANTLVPPPYSRAASPDLPLTMHDYSMSTMPRSASQQACSMEQQQARLHHQQAYRAGTQASLSNGSNNDVEHIPLYHRPFGTPNSDRRDLASATTGGGGGGTINYSRTSDDLNLQCSHNNDNDNGNDNSINDLDAVDNKNQSIAKNVNRNGDRLLNINMNVSHSDQQFRYGLNKSNSNLSVPNSCDVIPSAQTISSDTTTIAGGRGYGNTSCTNNSTNGNSQYAHSDLRRSIDGSCSGGVGTSDVTMATGTVTASAHRESSDLIASKAGREQQQLTSSMRQQMLSGNFSEESPVNADILKKYGSMRSYINSITGSAVSSLANIGSPTSPPQATSPTGEVKELLEKIRQLQESAGNSRNDDDFDVQRQSDATTFSNDSTDAYDGDESSTSNVIVVMHSTKKRPSTLQQNRRTNHRTRFFPMSAAKNLRSPIGSTSGILGFGRGRKGWISKSAPTTPGTAMPSCFLDDDSPLLNEHDEDADQNT